MTGPLRPKPSSLLACLLLDVSASPALGPLHLRRSSGGPRQTGDTTPPSKRPWRVRRRYWPPAIRLRVNRVYRRDRGYSLVGISFSRACCCRSRATIPVITQAVIKKGRLPQRPAGSSPLTTGPAEERSSSSRKRLSGRPAIEETSPPLRDTDTITIR